MACVKEGLDGSMKINDPRYVESIVLTLQERITNGINNPLATISSCTEGLMARLRDKKLDHDLFISYLAIIDEEVYRCRNVTANIPSFVSMNKGVEAINMTEVIRRGLDLLSSQGRLGNITINQRISGSKFDMYSKVDILQMFMAVINHSIDSMPDGGDLIISVICKGKYLLLSICDTGRKIPDECIIAFNSSDTAEARKGRACYNLLMARDIVHGHGGEMNIIHPSEVGNILEISLPYNLPSLEVETGRKAKD